MISYSQDYSMFPKTVQFDFHHEIRRELQVGGQTMGRRLFSVTDNNNPTNIS